MFAEGYELAAKDREELARRVVDVAILSAASDAVEAKITPNRPRQPGWRGASPGVRVRRRGSSATVALLEEALR